MLNTPVYRLSTYVSYLFFGLCIILPAWLAIVIYKKILDLEQQNVYDKYKAFIECLKINQGTAIIFQSLFFFLKRLILAIVVVLQDSFAI